MIKICKRIVGGGFVDNIQRYPFMATLWYLDGSEFTFKSGAVYIGKKYFLTAAHCVKHRDPQRTLIRMGNCNIRSLPETFRVVRVFKHPQFNETNLRNDIAVVEVDRVPSDKFTPVRLPCNHLQNYCYNAGDKVIVLGFGKENTKSGVEQHLENLKEVSLKIRKLSDSRYNRRIVTNDMFLAGDFENGVVKDACTGDSGGPCIKLIKGNWVIVGIVSWGNGCSKIYYPGVYTKVLSYHQWIRQICGFAACTNH